MTTLALENLLEIHAVLIQDTGGSVGLRDLGRLESVVATQTQNVFGTEIYQTATEKAAAMIRGSIADHPFVDGNKRTAMLVGFTFLKLNGYKLKIKDSEIEDLAVKIASEKLDVLTINSWLKSHVSR